MPISPVLRWPCKDEIASLYMLTFPTLHAKPTIGSDREKPFPWHWKDITPIYLSSSSIFPVPTNHCLYDGCTAQDTAHHFFPYKAIPGIAIRQYLPSWLTVYVKTCCPLPIAYLSGDVLLGPGGPHSAWESGRSTQTRWTTPVWDKWAATRNPSLVHIKWIWTCHLMLGQPGFGPCILWRSPAFAWV